MKIRLYLIFNIVLIAFLNSSLNSQTTRIRGSILEQETNLEVPYATISWNNNTKGTISNDKGAFFIETDNIYDSILISSVGYLPKYQKIKNGNYQEIVIHLTPDNISIDEIVVLPGENPAHKILHQIIEHKNANNIMSKYAYQCDIYNKTEIAVDNIKDQFRFKKLEKEFGFVYDYIDTSTLTGKRFLPLIISETNSKLYRLENGDFREVIEASQVSGLENASVSQFTGAIFQSINMYDNYVTLFDPGFVSPISNFGLLFYKYRLEDTIVSNNIPCYKIAYYPKRKGERTFHGYFLTDTNTFALKEIEFHLANGANINYINRLVGKYSYSLVNDSSWMLSSEEMEVEFNVVDVSTGFRGKKTSIRENYILGNLPPPLVNNMNTKTLVLDSALIKSDNYWNNNRPIELSEKEKNIYYMVDSINNIPFFQNSVKFINMLTKYYWVMGPFEYGPYYTTYSFNDVEGDRIRLGGRTSNDFSTKDMIFGHIAYGFADERFKYGIGYLHMFNKKPRTAASIKYEKDMRQLGDSDNAFLEDNIMASLLSRTENNKLLLVESAQVYFEKEWFQGFSNNFQLELNKILPSEIVPFRYPISDILSVDAKSLVYGTFNINTRYAKDEQFLLGEFERISLGTKSPVINLNLKYGLGKFDKNEFNFQKVELKYEDKIETNPFGYLLFYASSGKYFGQLPYPIMKMHEGNETYAFDPYAYNMMNYYEFVSDEYVSLYLEQHFQGFFLNKLPLIKKLKFREVCAVKSVAGTAKTTNLTYMETPFRLSPLNGPYVETYLGIENILRFFRVDVMWRLTQLNSTDVKPLGIRIGMQLIL